MPHTVVSSTLVWPAPTFGMLLSYTPSDTQPNPALLPLEYICQAPVARVQ